MPEPDLPEGSRRTFVRTRQDGPLPLLRHQYSRPGRCRRAQAGARSFRPSRERKGPAAAGNVAGLQARLLPEVLVLVREVKVDHAARVRVLVRQAAEQVLIPLVGLCIRGSLWLR